eukprot:g1437.t1
MSVPPCLETVIADSGGKQSLHFGFDTFCDCTDEKSTFLYRGKVQKHQKSLPTKERRHRKEGQAHKETHKRAITSARTKGQKPPSETGSKSVLKSAKMAKDGLSTRCRHCGAAVFGNREGFCAKCGGNLGGQTPISPGANPLRRAAMDNSLRSDLCHVPATDGDQPGPDIGMRKRD